MGAKAEQPRRQQQQQKRKASQDVAGRGDDAGRLRGALHGAASLGQ